MARSQISLDGPWEFYPDPDQRLQHDTLAQTAPRLIAVPGPWQAQFEDLRDYTGVAWYRRTFDLPGAVPAADGTAAQPWHIHFGAADYHTTVWVNGKRVGEHEGGYLPFDLALDGALRPGSNELVVRVIDPSDDVERFPDFPLAQIPHGKQSWYGPIGGLWQSVYLEARHPLHLTRLRITPGVAEQQAHVLVRLSAPAPQPVGLLLSLTDPRGGVSRHSFTIPAGSQEHGASLPVHDPLLWDTDNPHLYRLEAALTEAPAGELIGMSAEPAPARDTLAANFGMRTIATSPEGHLLLNGRILYLRGALDQDYYPDLIYTPFDDAALEDQFAKARHMGLNCLRTHIKITDPRYYDAADRAGMLIWTELPNWETLTPAARRRARDTLQGMVERDWNHPSIIIWTIINEGWGVDLAVNADHRVWLAETYAFLKALDPHRLVVGNSPCYSNFHVVTDIEDFHNYYAIPDHRRQWRDWVETFAGRPPWTFASDYSDIEAWREYARDPWNPAPRTPAPEAQRRGNEPMLVSEFGNWGLPDIGLLKQHYGGREPWWFETGMEWGDGVVYPHGVDLRFKAFHLDKVFPTFADLAAASQRMQFIALKYEIEQIRRHASIVGYVITEFTDVHWESNGLLDMCRNPKSYYDAIGHVNSADAIVPDWERAVFWEGERCEVRLALSHFSGLDLRGSRLEWHLDLWPDLAGRFEALSPQNGQVADIGTVVFDAPPVEQSVRARLELRLLDAAGELVARNHHELYVFPRAAGARPSGAPPIRVCAPDLPEIAADLAAMGYEVAELPGEADLVLAATLTDEVRGSIQRGGRVLWLAETPDAKQTYLGPLGIAQRQGRSWQGDWASNLNWVRQDRLFKSIPTGGLVDFAFADLIPESVIVGLKASDFAASVHAGLFVGWIHHVVALVAERRYGNGLLLISTFLLRRHLRDNPVARIMLHDLLTHAARTPLGIIRNDDV